MKRRFFLPWDLRCPATEVAISQQQPITGDRAFGNTPLQGVCANLVMFHCRRLLDFSVSFTISTMFI